MAKTVLKLDIAQPELIRRMHSSKPGDIQWYIETFFKVRHKMTGKVIPAILMPAQKDFLYHRTSRDMIGKARSQYISSVIEMINTKFALTNPGIKIAIVAQPHASEDWPKKHLNQMRFYYQSMPDAVHCIDDSVPIQIKPDIGEDSAYHMAFPGLGSEIISATGGSAGIGHGQPYHIFHGTEVPYWPDDLAKEIIAGFEGNPTIKWIVLESTGGGEGGIFYDMFTKALGGLTEYKAHFYGWFWDKDNCKLPEGSAEALPEDRGPIIPTPEEVELMLRYDLDTDNIRWRRRQHSKELGQQESAEDPVTMFLVSGQPVFDLRWTDRMIPRCRKPVIEEDSGCLKIWKPPVTDGKYMVWSDPSGGDPTGHPSGSVVCRINPFEHVATLRGHWDSQVHKQKADALAKRYNNAFRGWERNNHGAAWEIGELGFNCYRHDDKKMGFPVNAKTKPMLRDYMAELLSVDGVETYDSVFVDEIRSWRHFGDKMEPAINKTDDILMPFMEANYARIKGIAANVPVIPVVRVRQTFGRR